MAESAIAPSASGWPAAWPAGVVHPRVARFCAARIHTLAICLGFSIPISTSLTEVLLGLFFTCWLLSGDYAARFEAILRNKVTLLAVGMFGLYAIGLIYTSAPWAEAGDALLGYRKFLYIGILMTAFTDPRTRRAGILAFLAAMFLTLGASFLTSWGVIRSKWGTPEDCSYFKNHIAQGILMALMVALLASHVWQNRRGHWRRGQWFCAIVAAIGVYNIFFMIGGRTGYLVLFALAGLFAYRQKGWRGLALTGILGACTITAAYSFVDRFRDRIDLAVQEASDYYHLQRDSIESSIGRRLLFYRTVAVIASQDPVLGAGTGSFRTEFLKIPENQGKPPESSTHNEFFSVLVQIGLPGLLVFLYWLYVQWKCASRLSPDLAFLGQAAVVIMVVAGLVNSIMSSTTEGFMYCYFTALCCGAMPRQKGQGESMSTLSQPSPSRQEHREAA